MARPALRIEVAKKDQRELEKMLSGGVQPVRAVLRAMALLQLAKGDSAPRIAEFIPLTPQAIRKVGHRYVEGGLSGRSMKRNGRARLLCSKTARNRGSSPWSAPVRRKAMPA